MRLMLALALLSSLASAQSAPVAEKKICIEGRVVSPSGDALHKSTVRLFSTAVSNGQR